MVLDKLITLEDANSLLSLNPNFNMDYIINVGDIPREYFSEDFEDYVYDFNVISMKREKGNIKFTTDEINKVGIFKSDIPINNSIVNFNMMLETNNPLNNNLYMIFIDENGEETDIDLINDMNIQINQQTSQSDWYEITIITTENTIQVLLNDELYEEWNLSSDEIYFGFKLENVTTIQTINVQGLKYQKLDGKVVFNDEGENIHWTSDDDIKRTFKNQYTQVQGTGYTRPNYDDVYNETKLYKSQNHMIEFNYSYKKEDFLIFNDLGTNNSHNTHYNKISGFITYSVERTKFQYDVDSFLNLNYYISQCELNGDWEIDFKFKTDDINNSYFVFNDELKTIGEENIIDELHYTNLTGLSNDTLYYFKIIKNGNRILIRYSTNGTSYRNLKYIDDIEENKLYFNFVLDGENNNDVSLEFSDLKIYNNNKVKIVLSNYNHTATTVIDDVYLDNNDNVKIILLGMKIILLLNDDYYGKYIFSEDDDYSYTLFNFYLEDAIFQYKNFKMYTYNNEDTVQINSESVDSIIDENNLYHYIVEVYNKLWTGEVTFDRISSNEEIVLYTDNKLNYNDETYIFHTICSDDDFDIILKLDNTYEEERVFEDIKPAIQYKDETWMDKYKMFYTYKMSVSSNKNTYSYLYYQEPNITITVKDMYGQKVQDAKVIIPSSIYASETTLTTDANGQVTFKPKRLKPKTYTTKIKIKKEPFDSESKKITYNDTYINVILKPQKENLTVTYNGGTTYWGGYVNDTLRVNAQSNYNVKVSLTCNKSLINSKVNKSVTTNSSFTHEQSYRTKRYDNSSITISVKATDWSNPYKKSFTKKHSLKYVDNWTQLKNEIDNTKGVDIVGLKQKNYTVNDDVIYYKRDMEILGINNNEGWAKIKGAKKYCFVNKSPSKKDYIKLKISNIEFSNNIKVFKHYAYANLEIENCLFYNNGKGNSNVGICIETPITDSYIDKNYGNIKVTSCNFINNKGSNIGTSMNINIDTCRFGLNDWEYAQHPQCWAMEIYGQKATVKDCDFAVVMNGKSPLAILRHSNFSHGKAILRIGTSAYVNGTKGSSCKKNNSSPLLYNGNTSYLYAKYKYDGVNVTASPNKNFERFAHDIVVNGTDWAWKNNVSVSTVYDNTKDKPKITVPKSPKDNAKILKKGGRQKW